MSKKIGISRPNDSDFELIEGFLKLLQESKQDFTLGFYLLAGELDAKNPEALDGLIDFSTFADWLQRWKSRLEAEQLEVVEIAAQMRQTNPVLIPRNHQIELVIKRAVENDSIAEAKELNEILNSPFTVPSDKSFCLPPKASEIVKHTFCGT